VVDGVPGALRELMQSYTVGPQHPTTSLLHDHGIAFAPAKWVTRRVSAASAVGKLVATVAYEHEVWEGKETFTPERLAIALEPTNVQAARHVPIPVPHETAPIVLETSPDHFLLMTRAGPAIRVRAIAIDASYFTRPRPPRPTVLTGKLHKAQQDWNDLVGVMCLDREACGETKVGADGAFAVPPKDPLDYRYVATHSELAIVAQGAPGEFVYEYPLKDHVHDLQLQPAATLIGALLWPGGHEPAAKPLPPKFVNGGPRGQIEIPQDPPHRLTLTPHEIVPVARSYGAFEVHTMYSYGPRPDGSYNVPVAGTHHVLMMALTADQLYGASRWVDVAPGATTSADLQLDKTATVRIEITGVAQQDFDDHIRLASGTCASYAYNICEYEHVPPGPNVYGVTTTHWTMLREIDVAPGETKKLKVPFVADLPPGHPGVAFERAIDGIAVASVAPGGPAVMQLQIDDLIVSIDGKRVTTLDDAIARARGTAGATVTFEILRAGKAMTVTYPRSRGTQPLGFTVLPLQ
jgi:hypothetical protein